MLNQDYRDMLSWLKGEGNEPLVAGAYALAARGCLLALCVLFAAGCRKSQQGAGAAQHIFDQYVERVRSSRYWGDEHDDQVYVEGKQISALVFWTKTTQRPKYGLCAAALKLCIANYSSPNYRGVAEVSIDPSLEPKLAFASFAERNYGDGDAWRQSLNLNEFEFEERIVTLPALGLPAAISHKLVSEEAVQEVERYKKVNACWRQGIRRPSQCTGTLVFAYYNEADLNWFTLRTCSPACSPEFRGDSIQLLSRREWGWTVTVGGFLNNPEAVKVYKPKIEKAEMFRVETPPTPVPVSDRPYVSAYPDR
jgi:hypothetical protein